MTHETYSRFHSENYKPKHSKQTYRVWLVKGPAGPVVEYYIEGYQEARESILGGWDYEIVRLSDGKVMPI